MSFYLNDAAKLLLVMYDYNLELSSKSRAKTELLPHSGDGTFAMNISMMADYFSRLPKDNVPVDSEFDYERLTDYFLMEGKIARMNVGHLLGNYDEPETDYYIITDKGRLEAEELKRKVVKNPVFKRLL